MYTEPPDLDRRELAALLERGWRLKAVELEYLPVGFGSHHWLAVDARGTRRFVTVDDLEAGSQRASGADAAFATLDRAFRTAAALRDDAELEFVVAPIRNADGGVIRRMNDRYALTVLPFVEGESSTFGAYESAEERRRMGRLLGRLHAATRQIPADLPGEDDLSIPSRGALADPFADLEGPWADGPYGEPARLLLRAAADAVELRLREYDELAREVRRTAASWVITHGEPHRANVIRGAGGDRFLVDWDTALVAPRERDLRMVLDREGNGWAEYLEAAGPASVDQHALRLYGLWWDLADISIYVADFRRPHEQTEDSRVAWDALRGYLEPLIAEREAPV